MPAGLFVIILFVTDGVFILYMPLFVLVGWAGTLILTTKRAGTKSA